MRSRFQLILSLLVSLAIPSAAHAAVISFGFTAVNLSPGPVPFHVAYGSAITPDLYAFASVEGSVLVTPGLTGTGTASLNLQPNFVTAVGVDGFTATELVATGLGPCVAVRVPTLCNFALVTASFAPTFYNELQALLSFTLDGGVGAQAEFSGEAHLEVAPPQTPEPSSLCLLATAAAGAWRARRRSRV